MIKFYFNFFHVMRKASSPVQGQILCLKKGKTWRCTSLLSPIALRKAKIGYNFGLSECSRVKTKNFILS